MLGKIFELGSLVKQANEFGGRMRAMNDKLKEIRVDGSAAGGLVVITVNGLQEIVSCKIDPAVFQQGDAELLEELVVDAANSAIDESRSKQNESMASLAECLDVGDLTETLKKIMPK
jgi:DNA-binding YbaB/EbfC family protein